MLYYGQNQEKRLIHFDLLRLVAIYLVIFNHTGDRGYSLFINQTGSPMSLLYMFFSVFCKIAVPLFFMISGALLLKKEESLKQLFLKRVLRIALVLFLSSIPYYYWLHKANGIGIWDFFSWIYSDSATTSFWYLYSYLALLLMLPFLRCMVKSMQQKDFIYLIIGYIVFVGCMPCMEYLIFNETNMLHESFYPVFFMTQNIFFALLGYFVEHFCDTSLYKTKTIIWCSVWSIIAILVTCLITFYQGRTGSTSVADMEKFFNCFIAIPAATVYLIIKNAGVRIENKNVCRCMSILGSAVFGVYLIEKIMRSFLSGVYYILNPLIGSFLASLVWCFMVLCFGLIVIIALKHIPFVKKVITFFI